MVLVSSNKIAAYKRLQTLTNGNFGRIKVIEYPMILATYTQRQRRRYSLLRTRRTRIVFKTMLLKLIFAQFLTNLLLLMASTEWTL